MPLHRLASITMGVPRPEETACYYAHLGLAPETDGWFSTRDGGRQLRIIPSPTRRLTEIHLETDDEDDLHELRRRLEQLGVPSRLLAQELSTHDLATRVRVRVTTGPPIAPPPAPATPYNRPGRMERSGRAATVLRDQPVRPSKLGHVVMGSTDVESTAAFFRDGLGFKVSDIVKDQAVFLRCSSDHHNVMVMAAPVPFLHHTSWEVDDIDEIGRGAHAMLEGHPERHVWGLGRHHAGANFFWYLKDPVGNFTEYYSDMDCIPDDRLWTPQVFDDAKGLFNWGPPPPPSFLRPDDLAELMSSSHHLA
ncbi:VOC family protein [Streptomyces sp. NPDC008001]|uniref:VOC family protein n=1 Tax=Streptomyces sp. NPDC008001 TaxID=3364804 RepID=UPI0036E2443E